MKVVLFSVLIVVFASCFVQGEAAALDEGAGDCPCAATANIYYVCGSNGVTYTNPSLLRCAERCTRQTITKVHDGKCE
ncbi:hypothetical protein TSAR_011780 [Trichomalopsis sarcophagae]|uniref:Kazal-like domain-containing protein n=1 Tax=Trichomalopsis sarcophagae TaxID=543379 RepID=A0A232F7Q0_9HYME|nr:hypothetical protein TSAR_011780 [Trichomalopsis sarcophagae]